MKQFQSFNCEVPDHGSFVDGICSNKECKQKSRMLCIECMRKLHPTCEYLSRSEFIKMLQDQKQILKEKINQCWQGRELDAIHTQFFEQIQQLYQICGEILNEEKYRQEIIQQIDNVLTNDFTKEIWLKGYELLSNQRDLIPILLSDIQFKLKSLEKIIFELDPHLKINCDWNIVTAKEPLTINIPSDVVAIACSLDGKTIATGGSDKFIYIWDPSTGKQVGEKLSGHTNQVRCLQYTKNSEILISSSLDHSIRLWNTTTHQQIGENLSGHTNEIRIFTLHPDEKSIISASFDTTIRIWNFDTRQEVIEKRIQHANRLHSLAISSDGINIVFGDDVGSIKIWNLKIDQQEGETLVGHKGWVYGLAYSSDSSMIVSSGDDATIRIWNSKTRTQIGESILGHTNYVWPIFFTPKYNNICSGGKDGSVRIWNSVTKKQIHIMETAIYTYAVQCSPDGKYLVAGGNGKFIKIFVNPEQETK